MISPQNLLNLGPVQNRSRFIKAEGNLDFSEFLSEAGIVQMVYFSNQTVYNVTNQLSLSSYFLPLTFHLSPNDISKILI